MLEEVQSLSGFVTPWHARPSVRPLGAAVKAKAREGVSKARTSERASNSGQTIRPGQAMALRSGAVILRQLR